MEQNASEHELMEKKLDDIIRDLEIEREKVKRLEADRKEAVNAKIEAENELDKVIAQTAAVEKRCKQAMEDLE